MNRYKNMKSSVSHGALILLLAAAAAFPAACQSAAKYQAGTVMRVKVHEPSSAKDSTVKSYDVSVKVGDTLYLVLYTPPDGSAAAEYKTGSDLPVMVSEDTLTFVDVLGRSTKLPILTKTRISKSTTASK